MSDILNELDWRGLYADSTDRDALAKRLAEGPLALYAGFDPTADSLHVGNLVPLFALRRFQLAGHKPIVLAGGATGMVGDPSGKSDERNLQTPEQVAHNIAAIQVQLRKFLDFDAPANPARLVNNADWFGPITFLEFLRDTGKYITVNSMVAKDSVRSRMEDRGTGISFTEFSYMLLQGYDFYHLRHTLNCELQVGATDQWGNITVGTELTRKKLGATVWGLVFPLLTKSDGSKYGKTASGTVWLDRNKTHPNEFYQFFLKTDDTDVIKLLKTLTFLDRATIDALAVEQANTPWARAAQKALAWEMTKLVHGEQDATEARKAAESTFGKTALKTQPEAQLAQTAASLPQFSDSPLNKSLTDAVALSGIAPSKGQARQLIMSGGIYVNGEQLKEPKILISEDMLLHGKYFFLRKGTSKSVAYIVPPAGVHPSAQQ